MDMNKFTEKSREAVSRAQSLTARLGHQEVDVEHMALALLTNPDGSYTDRANTILAHTPFGRFGEPEELLGTLQWLASDASGFVTGTVIPIDGGFDSFSI